MRIRAERIVTFGLLLGLCFLAGCATKWQKYGATEDEFEAMKASCMSAASSKFPVITRQVQISQGYVTPATTQCTGYGYSVNCYQIGGQYVPPRFMTVDDNMNAREQEIKSCFYQNGWTPVKDN